MISWTTGFIWAQVCNDDYLDNCFHACALINWSVMSQLASDQGSVYYCSCGILKQKGFCFTKLFANL
jgi:hypothetical protein